MNVPVSFGSQQLRLFRRAIREGLSIEEASEQSGIDLSEARMHAADDAKNPPPPEAYELLYDPDARAAAPTPKEDDMARGRMAREPKDDPEAGEGGGVSGEYKRPDAARALKIFTDEISPKHVHMATIKGDLSDPYKRIKDECHFPRKVLDFLMQLEDMEEAKRDHWLLAFRLGCTELQMFVPRDLVTMAQGEDGDDVIPVGEREDQDLLVDEDEEDDLPAAAQSETFTEASDQELTKQEGRGRGRATRPRSASITSIASATEARPH